MMSDGWADATAHMDQVNPGEWEWYVTWNDGTNHRNVKFRPIRDGEIRCDLTNGNGVCCLPHGHPGLHAPISEGQAAMPFLIAP